MDLVAQCTKQTNTYFGLWLFTSTHILAKKTFACSQCVYTWNKWTLKKSGLLVTKTYSDTEVMWWHFCSLLMECENCSCFVHHLSVYNCVAILLLRSVNIWFVKGTTKLPTLQETCQTQTREIRLLNYIVIIIQYLYFRRRKRTYNLWRAWYKYSRRD